MSALVCLSAQVQVVIDHETVHLLGAPDSSALDPDAVPLLLQCRQPQRLEELYDDHDANLVGRLLADGVLVMWGDDDARSAHVATVTDAAAPPFWADPSPVWVDDARLIREYTARDPVPLPAPASFRADFVELLSRRRSARAFDGTSVRITELATLLAASHGAGAASRSLPRVRGAPPARTAYPSPGALYPVEVGLLASRVSELTSGSYHYQPFGGQLARLGPLDPAVLGDVVPDHPTDGAAGLIVLWIDLCSAVVAKYHGKGYRLALLEAGHLMQNLVLVATALDLGALPVAGFRDAKLDRLLHLVPDRQVAVYALLFGRAGA